jgi:hypothetical protein
MRGFTMTNKTFKTEELDRCAIDCVIGFANFGEREFVANDGAFYENEHSADCTCYFVALDEDGEPDHKADSESASLSFNFDKNSGWTVDCEFLTNSEEVAKALNEHLDVTEIETPDVATNVKDRTLAYISRKGGKIHSVSQVELAADVEERTQQAKDLLTFFIECDVDNLYMVFGSGMSLSSKPTISELDVDVRWMVSTSEQ